MDSNMNHFLLIFVCTGNICRSPLAEGIMNDLLLDDASSSGSSAPVKVISAGTHALSGMPASEHAIIAAAEQGIDISRHLSRLLTSEMIGTADLILTMESAHADFIKCTRPKKAIVSELKTYAHKSSDTLTARDIMDPIGSNLGVYRRVFSEIDAEIRRVAPTILACARAIHHHNE
jgi:protein-tyrosine-phosphatase